MKGYRDPIKLLVDGEISCDVVTAGLRHAQQTEYHISGKVDYWRLDDKHYDTLSVEAQPFMNVNDPWNKKDDNSVGETQG